ncbi:hypothetical protein DW177_13410 [Blautia sp. AM16-16B]|nr:hypothetical protein DW177_13410 [Blautia sp. AM16-16B]RHR14323.1 hypothetical protein DWX49_11900 [Blautia sp. AF19-34]RHU43437.1 hypothetical protein DXD15_11120 [Blautia sp. TF11-31AT]
MYRSNYSVGSIPQGAFACFCQNPETYKSKCLRACLKNHFRNLQAPLCGRFYPRSVAVARYAALIRIKSPTN